MMKLFFVLVCCLAIPLVARAADQGNNNKGNKKPTTQGQQSQAGSQGKHNSATTASQLNNPSHVKSQG